MALPCPSVPGAPYPRCRRARQGMSDMCPVTATSKNPRKRRSASLWSRPAAFWAFPLGIPSKRLTGRSKARAAHCGIQQAAPYSVFAVGQTRLQTYLAKSASLCYNEHCYKCYTFCRLKLNWKYSISPAASLSYFAEYEGDSFCSFSCSSRHWAGYFHDASSKGSLSPLLCK